MNEEYSSVQALMQSLVSNIEKVIIGKQAVIEEIVIGLMSEGHILIEDVPGVGKTLLAKSLAKSLGCSFQRIQFTPDMLPSDVTGVSIFNQGSHEFEFRPGPVMAQIVLADEINRATPKTQSALLEAMEEKQVTVDGITHPLPSPFLVMSTQNPIEYEGTFPLPEAQLDRFLMKIKLGYPSANDEVRVLELQQIQHPIIELQKVIEVEALRNAQKTIRTVYVAPILKRYIVDLVRQTRSHTDIYLGSSPRGSLGLFHASQARAVLSGRDFVLPDDIKALASIILSHRVLLNSAARMNNLSSEQVIQEILNNQAVPTGDLTSGRPAY